MRIKYVACISVALVLVVLECLLVGVLRETRIPARDFRERITSKPAHGVGHVGHRPGASLAHEIVVRREVGIQIVFVELVAERMFKELLECEAVPDRKGGWNANKHSRIVKTD